MFWIIAFISPVSISPFSIAGNNIATYGRPEAALFAPQGIGQPLSVEFAYSSDFNGYINKYFAGIQYRGWAFGWLSLSVDEFSQHLFALGKSIKNFGINVLITPEEELDDNGQPTLRWYYGIGGGVIKVLSPLWVSASFYYGNGYIGTGPFGYRLTYDRSFGSISIMYPTRNYTAYLDAFMERGYPLEIRTGFLVKVHESVRIFAGYSSGSSAFHAGIVVSRGGITTGVALRQYPVLGLGGAGSLLIRR